MTVSQNGKVRISARSYLAASHRARVPCFGKAVRTNLEGFLFPATYDLSLDSDARDVVRRLKREFDRRWDILSRTRGSSLNDVMTSARLSVRDVVTLGSMIEKEAAVDDERPIIASVFLNRLRDPASKTKRLECDPDMAAFDKKLGKLAKAKPAKSGN